MNTNWIVLAVLALIASHSILAFMVYRYAISKGIERGISKGLVQKSLLDHKKAALIKTQRNVANYIRKTLEAGLSVDTQGDRRLGMSSEIRDVTSVITIHDKEHPFSPSVVQVFLRVQTNQVSILSKNLDSEVTQTIEIEGTNDPKVDQMNREILAFTNKWESVQQEVA